jgi:hypothetical protein
MTYIEINEAWIVGAVRTPIGRPDDLGTIILEALMQRTGVPPEKVEDVYMGCTNQVRDHSSSPPFKELMQSFIKHLHAFVSQVGLTGEEWFRAIDFLMRTGHMSDGKRQEFILPSDTLGVSTLVDGIYNKKPLHTEKVMVWDVRVTDGDERLVWRSCCTGPCCRGRIKE